MDLHNYKEAYEALDAEMTSFREKTVTLANQLAEKYREMAKLIRLVELDKLEFYLKGKGISYKRIDRWEDLTQHHQLLINCDEAGWPEWDVICHKGSYGYTDGLLEIAGSLVDEEKDGDSVVGYLTAQDVIDRIERKEKES